MIMGWEVLEISRQNPGGGNSAMPLPKALTAISASFHICSHTLEDGFDYFI